MRSIRSAGLAGTPRAPVRAAVGCTRCCSDSNIGAAVCQQAPGVGVAHVAQSVGWTVSRTRSNTANPTGLVSMRRKMGGPPRSGKCFSGWLAGASAASWALGQPAKHQQVVLRGVIIARRQLRIQQVRHVQVEQLQPAQGLQCGLKLVFANVQARRGRRKSRGSRFSGIAAPAKPQAAVAGSDFRHTAGVESRRCAWLACD